MLNWKQIFSWLQIILCSVIKYIFVHQQISNRFFFFFRIPNCCRFYFSSCVGLSINCIILVRAFRWSFPVLFPCECVLHLIIWHFSTQKSIEFYRAAIGGTFQYIVQPKWMRIQYPVYSLDNRNLVSQAAELTPVQITGWSDILCALIGTFCFQDNFLKYIISISNYK